MFAATSQLLPFGLPDAAHYSAGRFSNGGNYADVLADMLHVDLAPSLLGGTNFAFGGARTDYNVVEFPPFSFPPGAFPWSLNGERDAFLATANRNADPTTLYVVFSGSNDMGDILSLQLNPVATIAKTVTGIRDAILAFKAMGARTVLVPNLPNLGLTPRAAQVGAQGPLTALAQAYNNSLDAMLDDFTDINIIRFDTFGFVTDVVAHPANYGFTNVTQACYTGFVVPDPTTTECADPDHYLFWDVEHPTRRFHAVFAEAIFTLALLCEKKDHGAVMCSINAHNH